MQHTKKPLGPHSKMARGARFFFKVCFQKAGQDFEDAPPLPLSPQDRYWLMSMKGGPLGYLVACYASSLEACEYEVFDHPYPSDYVRGVMACSTLSEQVRGDAAMLQRFPPRKLAGLDEATFVWSSTNSTCQLDAA